MALELSVVGKRLPRPDGAEKATGAARFTTDIKLPGMLIGKVLRSPHPHAKIVKIDTSKAKKLPGVAAVITYEDVPKKLFNMNEGDLMAPEPIASGIPRDQHILTDKARYVGDGIAAVAAVDESVAEEALDLIEVEYEKLSAVFDPIEAMKPDASRIHDFAEGNIATHMPHPFATGDVEKGFQEADYVVEATFRTSRQKHCQVEPSTCIASFDTSGRLTVWSPAQAVFLQRRKIADIFGIPEGMVRWLTPHVSGSFGNALSLKAEPICVALAKKTGKPVKLEFTREEQFMATDSRQPFILTGKMGVKKDGTITALQAKSIANAGAYFSTSGAVTAVCLLFLLGSYRCPNIAGEADIVYTNTPISGGMRGYGNPQAMWVLEQLADMAAEKIGMDPVEFRLKSHAQAGDPSWFPLAPIDTCALAECLKVGAEKIGWPEKRKIAKQGVTRRGVGMACTTHSSSASPMQLEHTNAFVKLNEDGSANLAVSASDMGQGILGVLAQIAAEELGLPAQDIHIVTGDTDVTMFDVGQHASRSAYVVGSAVQKAAAETKRKLLERAAKALEVSAEELDVKDRRVYVKAAPEKGITIAEVARNAIYNFEGASLQISGRCSFEPKLGSPPFQAAFAEVEVDTETGEVKVLRMVIADDIGRAINPMTVEGQLEGGAAQGIGYALSEDLVINQDTGVVESDNFTTYRYPSTLDLPELEIILVEQPGSSDPFGAKGVGELGIITMAPAIANAIYDAVGVRITDLPITPEKVIKALKSKSAVS